jgi:hypothetical protein
MDNQITYPIAKSERRKWDKHILWTPPHACLFTKENFHTYARLPTVAFHHFSLQSPFLESRAAIQKKNSNVERLWMPVTNHNENLVTLIGYRVTTYKPPKKKKKKTFDLCLINDLLVSTRYHPQLSSAQRFHNPLHFLDEKCQSFSLFVDGKRSSRVSLLSVIPNNRRPLTGYWIQQFMGVAFPRYNGSCEPIPSH